MNNKKNNYQRPVMDVVKIQQVQMVCTTTDPQHGGPGGARFRGESSGDSKFDELW